jgi:predicted small lipoprotein YifL
MGRAAALVLLTLLLAACGTKGALYIPPPESSAGTGQDSKQKPR